MRHDRGLGIIAVILVTTCWIGCRCGAPADEGEITPAEIAADVTGDSPTEGGEADGESAVSADVRQLIDDGDAGAIAAEMERRAARLRVLVGGTEERAGELENTAEAMTGREATVDPRDPAAVDSLVAAAAALGEGSAALEANVAEARQLATDLQALADALYGRPATPPE